MTYAIAPTCNLVTQPYACTTVTEEWYDPTRCPQTHYFHAGIDLSRSGGSCGQPVVATRAGVVAAVGIPGHSALGPAAVRLDVDGGFSVLYGHLVSAAVAPGQPVRPGDLIGHIGTQGASTGCHIHVEVRTTASVPGGQLAGVIDPTPYLSYLPPPPPPPAKEIEMLISDGQKIWVVGAQGKRWITSPPEFYAWAAAGFKVQNVSTADAANIPNIAGVPN